MADDGHSRGWFHYRLRFGVSVGSRFTDEQYSGWGYFTRRFYGSRALAFHSPYGYIHFEVEYR